MTVQPRMPIIEWKNARVVVPLVLLQSAIYMTLNQRSLGMSVATPATAVDNAIEFWSWTVWPYLALIALPPVLALMIRDRNLFRRTISAYLVAITLTFATFVIWPTHCPRPSPPTDNSWSSAAYRSLIGLDGPSCAFPSGHIIVPAVLCWAVWRDHHPQRHWAIAAFLLCSPSILTTKQHHAWDLIGGLAVAALGVLASGLINTWQTQSSDETQ